MNDDHHEHAGHSHGHGQYGRHGHGHAATRPRPRDAAFSLLRASIAARLAIAGAAIATVWAGVIWAMA